MHSKGIFAGPSVVGPIQVPSGVQYRLALDLLVETAALKDCWPADPETVSRRQERLRTTIAASATISARKEKGIGITIPDAFRLQLLIAGRLRSHSREWECQRQGLCHRLRHCAMG